MPSEVLALKYRPRVFQEVVGQETTVRILTNALAQRRLHHAYLFTGPRGIGKTTLARIFAKALNCEKGPTPTPCQECLPCREIVEGRSLAVIEIDGASNTSVDDVRDLRERIRYLPAGGRYKIYLIDEVHMLSLAAFNALLKTLEEPPPHALFLFATTEPQKVPLTILSRVIRFDLRPIPVRLIVDRLRTITQKESIPTEEEALYRIAHAAEGALRDALSLLDQALSFSEGGISATAVEAIVGPSTLRFLFDLTKFLLEGNASRSLEVLKAAGAAGVEPKRLSLDLLEYFRHAWVAQVSDDATLFDLPPEEVSRLKTLSQTKSPEDLDRLFLVLQRGLAEILRSPRPQTLLEVLILRLCRLEALRSLDEILKILSSSGPAIPIPSGTPKTQDLFSSDAQRMTGKGWPEFLAFLRSKRPQLFSILEPAALEAFSESEVVLQFPPHSLHISLLQEPDRENALREVLQVFFGRPLKVSCRTAGTVQPPQDPTEAPRIVDDAISVFGPATVVSPLRGAS